MFESKSNSYNGFTKSMSQTAFSNHKVFDAIFLFVHHLCVRVLYHFEPATVSNKRFRLHMTAVLFFLSLFFYLSRFPKIWLNQKLRSEKKAERFIHVHCGMKHIWSHWTCNCTSFLYHLARMAARCALAI